MTEKAYIMHKNSGIKMCRCVQERVVTTGGKLIICKKAQDIGCCCIIIYRHGKHSERCSTSKIFRPTWRYSLLPRLDDLLLRFNFFGRSYATKICSD